VALETRPGERRVAATPETTKKLVAAGIEVVVERGAGLNADVDDDAFVAAGATIADRDAVWACDVVAKVAPPTHQEATRLAAGATVVSFAYPDESAEAITEIAARGASLVGMEFVPRTARAQKMDALSSTANLAGYRAVLEAAHYFGRFFPMLMTAAGTVPPAHVLVIGAGVAGLSAIATAKRLGAVVRAFDTRPAVKDQVKSLGARFLDIEVDAHAEDAGGYAREASAAALAKEREVLARSCRECDIVITTALVAGRTAPVLITAEMVRSMKRGSVIVDLAAQRGGNCELTVADQVVESDGVTIIGHTNLASRMAADASRLYARNVLALSLHLKGKGERFDLASEDDIVRGVVLVRDGERVHAAVKPAPVAENPAPEAVHG
jgi:NAD(P) transhydrogenase subunit alpha